MYFWLFVDLEMIPGIPVSGGDISEPIFQDPNEYWHSLVDRLLFQFVRNLAKTPLWLSNRSNDKQAETSTDFQDIVGFEFRYSLRFLILILYVTKYGNDAI